MNLDKLFELYEQEEERRYQEELSGPEPMSALKRENIYKLAYDNFKFVLGKHVFGKTTLTGENLDAMQKYDISVEEASIIYMYTSHGIFDDVNSQLRCRPEYLDEDIKEYCRLLDDALEKMPSHNKCTVYRDISCSEEESASIINNYRLSIEKEIIESAFVSTHIENERWSEASGVHIIIKTKEKSNGKGLMELSFNATEGEVLFKKGTPFKVDGVDVENNMVYLTEI